MYMVGASYWNTVYGLEPGDVNHDNEGMNNMKSFSEKSIYNIISEVYKGSLHCCIVCYL